MSSTCQLLPAVRVAWCAGSVAVVGGTEKGREAVCQPLQPQRGEEARRVLRETPSLTPGIADAIVMKDGNLFFLCGPDGSVPLKNVHALGLYYHDCRYLRG